MNSKSSLSARAESRLSGPHSRSPLVRREIAGSIYTIRQGSDILSRVAGIYYDIALVRDAYAERHVASLGI